MSLHRYVGVSTRCSRVSPSTGCHRGDETATAEPAGADSAAATTAPTPTPVPADSAVAEGATTVVTAKPNDSTGAVPRAAA